MKSLGFCCKIWKWSLYAGVVVCVYMYGLMCVMEFKRLCFLWIAAFQLIHLVSGMGVFLGANINRDDDQLMSKKKKEKTNLIFSIF